MNSKIPLLLGLSTVLLVTSCAASVETAPNAKDSTTSVPVISDVTESNTQSALPSTSAESKEIMAEDIVPSLKLAQSDTDLPPEEIKDASIKKETFRALAPLSYAREYAAVNESGDLCLVAWASSGDGDGPATLNGPKIQCENPTEAKENGISLKIESDKDKPGVVLAMLPPEITEDVARSVLLKIPGNHEDLRPPVEFRATEDGLVSVAMEPETAKDLGEITFPRKDGSDFVLSLV